jgi:GTP-binding protein HflX
VLDRTGLILDIFATHARTHEGRIQVELAQYKYLLPRLRRQWLHLERQAGGGGASAGGVVGLRGPGETQLELDRRIIGHRIALLERQIDEVHRHREQYRERRRKSGVPIVALVGYTNAGKSTLLNALSGADVRAEDRLFATLDPTTRQVTLPGGQQILLTDTVGFIQKLPTQLVAAFRATLEEIREADLLLHVLDITHANAAQQTHTVMETLKELRADERPMLTVLNKVDLLDGVDEAEVGRLAGELGLPEDYVAVSAERGWGLETLLKQIDETLGQRMSAVTARIPYKRNDLVALWHQRGVIDEERYEAEGTYIAGRLPSAIAGQLAPFQVEQDGAGATQ